MRRVACVGLLMAVAAAGVLVLPTTSAAGAVTDAPADETVVQVLSNRADLVSGGDALIEVVVPAGVEAGDVLVDVDGRDVSDAFARRDDGRFYGLVDGLPLGESVVTATLPDGSGARLELTNHPIGGPVFAGEQVEPWICTTESAGLGPPVDDQCNAETIYLFQYKDSVTGTFQEYDPDNPPPEATVAETTTDEGETVPYIVRTERGTIDRGIYDITVLFDPDQPWTPWASQRGWNHKLSFLFGSSCNPGHVQASAVDTTNDMMLSRGFAVAGSSVNVFGNVCNHFVAAESLMMIKERITEQYGTIRYTIGNGCSGGSEAQNSIADNYPGLLQGILPQCTFADAWTPAIHDKFDCALFNHYFNEVSPELWAAPSQRGAVLGGPLAPSLCAEAGEAFAGATWDPTTGCGDDGADWMYDPENNPDGVRCTLQDYHSAALGRGLDGWGYSINDHVGREFGRAALERGDILPEQFVDLNENIGGFDRDFQWQPERTTGDATAIARMYRTGQLTYGRNIAEVASIDVRTDDTYDFHSNVHRLILRARVDEANGHHDSQVYWFETQPGAFGMPTPQMVTKSFLDMDRWLTAVEADDSDAPLAEKVVRNKPEDLTDGCYTAGQRNDDQATCEAAESDNVLPRMVAGEPLTGNVLKCRLKPLDRDDYTVTFTDDQWARLQAAFPDGVCDYSRPGVGFQAPVAGDGWLTLASGPGGEPLPAPPTSTPFGGPVGGPASPTPGLPATGGSAVPTGLALFLLAGWLWTYGRSRAATLVR